MEGVPERFDSPRDRAEFLRLPGVFDHPLGLHIDDARDHGNPAGCGADSGLEDFATALVSGEHDLGGGSEEEEAVHSRLNHAVDVALERLNIKRAIGAQWGDDGWDDPGERGCV